MSQLLATLRRPFDLLRAWSAQPLLAAQEARHLLHLQAVRDSAARDGARHAMGEARDHVLGALDSWDPMDTLDVESLTDELCEFDDVGAGEEIAPEAPRAVRDALEEIDFDDLFGEALGSAIQDAVLDAAEDASVDDSFWHEVNQACVDDVQASVDNLERSFRSNVMRRLHAHLIEEARELCTAAKREAWTTLDQECSRIVNSAPSSAATS